MKKATRGWPCRRPAPRRSMHLLDAGEQPAARAVGGFHEVPNLGKSLRLRAGSFAHRAREAHACPVLAALRGDLEQLRVKPAHLGLAAGLQILFQLLVEL